MKKLALFTAKSGRNLNYDVTENKPLKFRCFIVMLNSINQTFMEITIICWQLGAVMSKEKQNGSKANREKKHDDLNLPQLFLFL